MGLEGRTHQLTCPARSVSHEIPETIAWAGSGAARGSVGFELSNKVAW